SGGFDKEVRYWNAEEGKELKKLPATPDDIFALALSRDGKLAASAGYGGSLRVWEAESGKPIFNGQLKEGKKKTMITYCVVFTPDGKALVTGHEADNAARVTPIVANVAEKKEPEKGKDKEKEKEKQKEPEKAKDKEKDKEKDKKEADKAKDK